MQIHQMLAALSYGDAIGNEALRIQQILREGGFDSEIFAESVHPEMAASAKKLWDYRSVSSPDNLLILHFSIGAGVSTFAYHLPDPILLIPAPPRTRAPRHDRSGRALRRIAALRTRSRAHGHRCSSTRIVR